MTGPIIPAELWPAWADRHCWDENKEGHFYGTEPDTGIWMECTKRSNIPMPTGWDWRVPVMRPATAAKGGEQIADIVADWDANRCGPFKAMKRIKKHLDSLTFQPGDKPAPVAIVVEQNTAYSASPYGIKKLCNAVNLRAGTLLYAAPQPAPAIDLEQLRKTVADAMNFIAHFSWAWNGTGQHPNTIRTDLQSLLALIDGRSNVRSSSEQCSEAVSKGEEVRP